MRDWKRIAPAILLLVALSHCSTCSKTPLNFAAAFGWRGYADTDLSLASLGDEYTIAFKFMLQYPQSYAAPMLSDSTSGNFYVAKDYLNRVLVVNFHGEVRTYPAAPLPGEIWQHVSIVRRNGAFRVYHNGSEVCPDVGDCPVVAGNAAATGVLRFGRTADGVTLSNHEAQFYGFIDDVAIYKKALEPEGLPEPRLTGDEADLFAAYTFDSVTPAGNPLPAALQGPVTFKTLTPGTVTGNAAFPALVSQKRDSSFDAKLLPPPVQQTALKLPFPSGEAWQVIQGWDSLPGESHNGAASFCWDLILAGQPQSATEGKPIFAAAGGTVIETRNDRDSCVGPPSSYVMVEHAPVEIGAYLHFVMGSVEVSKDDVVATGTKLANAGDTGNSGCDAYHLHFSLHTAPESQAATLITFPAAFSDYEVSTDSGASWTRVDRGVPKVGEWVRNP